MLCEFVFVFFYYFIIYLFIYLSLSFVALLSKAYMSSPLLTICPHLLLLQEHTLSSPHHTSNVGFTNSSGRFPYKPFSLVYALPFMSCAFLRILITIIIMFGRECHCLTAVDFANHKYIPSSWHISWHTETST